MRCAALDSHQLGHLACVTCSSIYSLLVLRSSGRVGDRRGAVYINLYRPVSRGDVSFKSQNMKVQAAYRYVVGARNM